LNGLSKFRTIDPAAPDPAVILRAADTLRKGGMVVVPTRHLYGLGVDALNPWAVERVFECKQRPLDQALLILVASRKDVWKYAQDVDERAVALMDAFWPGKLTMVLKARSNLPAILTGGTGRIGIRLAGHPVCRAIVQALSGPFTATSANLSGRPGCHRSEDLHPAMVRAADLILDAGPLVPGIGSTVVDVRPSAVVVLREGAVAVSAIQNTVDGVAMPPPAEGQASGLTRRGGPPSTGSENP
jgi:L-threonylcarbamoyladenylate synthase